MCRCQPIRFMILVMLAPPLLWRRPTTCSFFEVRPCARAWYPLAALFCDMGATAAAFRPRFASLVVGSGVLRGAGGHVRGPFGGGLPAGFDAAAASCAATAAVWLVVVMYVNVIVSFFAGDPRTTIHHSWYVRSQVPRLRRGGIYLYTICAPTGVYGQRGGETSPHRAGRDRSPARV